MKTLILGDIHGQWPKLNTLLNQKRPDLILQIGDFGYWPGATVTRLKWVGQNIEAVEQSLDPRDNVKAKAPLHFVRGNHEDHPGLRDLEAAQPGLDSFEVAENVFYQRDGSTLTLPDGRVVLFFGGARSVDGMYREVGNDWHPDLECADSAALDRLPASADIVIAHTVPRRFAVPWDTEESKAEVKAATGWDVDVDDPSREVLDHVFERVRPRLWYAGHYHGFAKGECEGCKWTVLDRIDGQGRYWVLL